ncbi:unnamed protein product [Anisakis simplex]|uniref:RYDR_ITPR domain-containing protein n=1 Tax=Anisakis simplex TaxID=6269 RepID=A0A0M3K6Z3_ANISI|nr:unnamed protein product [Anisakis simplex]
MLQIESESTTAAIKSDDRFVSDSVSIFTNDDNVMGGFGRGNAVRGRRGVQGPDGWDTVPIADDESSQEWHSGKQIVDDEDRLSTASSTAYLEDMATTSRSGFNAPTGLQPSNGYSSAPMLRMDSERHEEELLTHSLRLLGQLFKNSEIRDTIKDALPDDYRLLYRYYGES